MAKKLFNNRTVPRWVILLVDIFVCCLSFTFSYFVLAEFALQEVLRKMFVSYILLYGLIAVIVFYAMKIHTGVIRYSNTQDMLRIFLAVLLCCLLYVVVLELVFVQLFQVHQLHVTKVLVMNFFIASSLLIIFRICLKAGYHYIRNMAMANKDRVLIYGSDSNALFIKQALESSKTSNFHIVGFLETAAAKCNSSIQQKKVYHIKALMNLQTKQHVDTLILMNEQLVTNDKKVVIEQCLKLNIKVLTVPPSDTWIYGELNLRQLRELKIQDLLQREPIVINNQLIARELYGKRVLITGAAGSIGSEIVRQVLHYKPEMVILFDQAESALYDVQLEMEERHPYDNVKVFIANIQNLSRLLVLFREYRPQIIFHAAAYKHVPMMEKHPSEAILTNVLGTKNLADLAVLYETEKFIMISTDKAVKPTNIMGASKRIAEMYVQSLSNGFDHLSPSTLRTAESMPCNSFDSIPVTKTKFITTRFGNVLNSSGSVVPRFQAQIQRGGPLTVTDPEITRFFMTIPEAVQLVLEAQTMGKGGEIFVFDMGHPVKIADLATNMIKLSGLTPGKDIRIVYTGLRPGEKLYEELLNDKEDHLPTHHEKIKIAKIISFPGSKIMSGIHDLIAMCDQEDSFLLVKKIKDLVPDFISKNSQYEKLDYIRLSAPSTGPSKEKSYPN